jgi:hypothetical protein
MFTLMATQSHKNPVQILVSYFQDQFIIIIISNHTSLKRSLPVIIQWNLRETEP